MPITPDIGVSNVTSSRLGNNVQEARTYDAVTGYLTGIQSMHGATTLRNLSHTFDALGNLTRRADTRTNMQEIFTYDNLNRVVRTDTTTAGVTSSVTVAYNALGNITAKSDVGTYTYGSGFTMADACGGAGPRAVKAVAGVKAASYCYDLNGAMVSGAGRTVTWSAFGMPVKIEQGLRAIEIVYGPDRARFKRIDRNETGTTTTHYVAGGAYEAVRSASGQVTHKTTVAGVAVVVDRQLTLKEGETYCVFISEDTWPYPPARQVEIELY